MNNASTIAVTILALCVGLAGAAGLVYLMDRGTGTPETARQPAPATPGTRSAPQSDSSPVPTPANVTETEKPVGEPAAPVAPPEVGGPEAPAEAPPLYEAPARPPVLKKLSKLVEAEARLAYGSKDASLDAFARDYDTRVEEGWAAFKAAIADAREAQMRRNAEDYPGLLPFGDVPAIDDDLLFRATSRTHEWSGADVRGILVQAIATSVRTWKRDCALAGEYMGIAIANAYMMRRGALWELLEGIED